MKKSSFLINTSRGHIVNEDDLIIALSPSAQRLALEYTRFFSLEIEYWPTLDPTGLHENLRY